MPSYDFRLQFDFAKGYRIDSDADRIELLKFPSGERITLDSYHIGTPIKGHSRAAISGGQFASKEAARTAAERSKLALLYWAINQRVGMDFGGRKQRSMATKVYLAILEKQHGHPFRNEIHGIDVYQHEEGLGLVSVTGDVVAGKSAPRLIDTFQREYFCERQLTRKQALAAEIYASSFFDVFPRTRFITLVTAVEALLKRPKRPDAVGQLVKEFKERAQLLNVDGPTRKSAIGSLEDLRLESITHTACALASRLIPNELFDGQPSADFFARCYKLRSQILHSGTVKDNSVDMLHLANTMESFVARLLLAVLNSVPQQGTDAKDGN